MGTSNNNMVYSFTEKALGQDAGMLCYQTAMKGEPTLSNLMKVSSEANTGDMMDESCKARDSSFGAATQAKAVLRADGLCDKHHLASPLGAFLSGTSLTASASRTPKRTCRIQSPLQA